MEVESIIIGILLGLIIPLALPKIREYLEKNKNEV